MALVAGVRDLRRLPKAELHLHLTGAMRPETLRELARGQGFEPPDPGGVADWPGFVQVWRAAHLVCKGEPRNLDRLVRETVADAAADGVSWLQPEFSPHSHGGPETWDAVLELVLAAGLDEAGRRDIGFGLTLGVPRHKGPDMAAELIRMAVRHVDEGVVAVGLGGDETAFPGSVFAPAFAAARDAGLTIAPHAGEMSGPESVREALDHLGATRLAHGVRAVEDPRLVELLAARGITLDVAVSSNLGLGYYRRLDEHPLPALLDAGVRCSLNSDDPLMFGSLLGEYELARSGLGFSDERLADLARTSFETSDAPAGLVADAVAGIGSWLTASERS